MAVTCERQRSHVDVAADLGAWFAEFRRLVSEAEERFDAGDYRPALASLAAIPSVHHMLVDACGAMLETTEVEGPADGGPPGLYL